MSRGRVRRPIWMTRQDARSNPLTLYLFGGNMERRGYAGQAAALRDEPNALGVPTKWRPGRQPRDYFDDQDWANPAVQFAISVAFDKAERALHQGRDVAIPAAGLGTGPAELPARAPVIFRYIQRRIAELIQVAAPPVRR